MAADHRRCDSLFSAAEELISKRDWAAGGTGFKAFRATMERHLAKEEEALFPAYEQRTGQMMGPTQIMRAEHAQMRQLLFELESAVSQQDRDRYLGLSETLMMIMQQHNMKEENMLYPTADRVFGDQIDSVLQQIERWNID
jgi:hemerythrin-like domain-containing protein